MTDGNRAIGADSGFVLLTKEEWKALDRPGRLDEAETGSGRIYAGAKDSLRDGHVEEFCRRRGIGADEWDSSRTGRELEFYDPADDEWFYDWFGDSVGSAFGRNSIKFVGSGLSKVVAVFRDGTALKMCGRPDAMEGEIDVSRNFPRLTCFPKMLDWQKDKDSCLVEAVRRDFEDEDSMKIYGVHMDRLVRMLTVQSDRAPENDAEAEFLERLETETGPEWRSVRDLRRYFREGRELDDVENHNWGLARRNGVDVPVVYDFDF